MAEPTRQLKTALWVLQIGLALAFTGAAVLKLVTPYEQLAAQMAWVRDARPWFVKGVGVIELVGAAGVILPAALRILPVLTRFAAGGLAFDMVMASGVHVARAEYRFLPVTLLLGGAAGFVAWRYSSVSNTRSTLAST